MHNRLRKNYRILKTLSTEQTGSPIPKAILTNQGFDFHTITKVKTENPDRFYFWVYDIGYIPLNEAQVLIVIEETDAFYQ